MATAVSLTEERITELMAGWEGVAVDQGAQAALIAALEEIMASQQLNLEEWNNIILPQLETDLANGSIAVANVVDNLIPDLQATLDAHTADLLDLNTVTLVALQDQLSSNSDWILELNDETIPDLITRLEANEAALDGLDLTGLNAALDALAAKFPVTGSDIAEETITAFNIEAHTITALQILADTITANEIMADTITANEIAAHTITAAEIFADTITANEIAADAITANEIAAHTITAAEIAADTITANEIAADAITANEIAAGTITAAEIASGTITADQIASRTIVAENIMTGSITADELAANVLTVNEIYAQEGYFGTIQANQIQSGSIIAEIGLLGALAVGQITIDPIHGITVPSLLGDTVLRADGSGSSFSGIVTTDELTVEGGFTLNAENNAINGSLKLANVVVAPTNPPTAVRYWPYSPAIGTDVMEITDSHDGLSWYSIYWSTKQIRRYTKSTGALAASITWPGTSDYKPYAMARGGSYFFFICYQVSTGYFILGRSNSSLTTFVNLGNIINSATNPGKPSVGWDYVNSRVITAFPMSAAGNARIQTWDISGNELSNNAYDLSAGPVSVTKDQGTYGVGRATINGIVRTWVNFGFVPQFLDDTNHDHEWWPGRAEFAKGMWWDGTKFVYLGYNTYRVYEWVTEQTTHNVSTVFGYSWYDSDVSGTGKHETQLGPTLTVTDWWYWSGLQIDTDTPADTGQPDSADSIALYIDNNRQADVTPGASRVIVRAKASGSASKTTNEFAGATAYPGSIKSVATFVDGVSPKLHMKGDGTGNWGDLTVDGNGKAVIGGDTGWIDITGFTLGWENYGSGYRNVGYRRIGSRVYLKGLIRGPGGGATGAMFTLPSGFRPPAPLIVAAIMSAWTDSSLTSTPNNATASHRHTVDTVVTNLAGRVNILADGSVNLSHAGYSQGASNYVSLEGINFLVD